MTMLGGVGRAWAGRSSAGVSRLARSGGLLTTAEGVNRVTRIITAIALARCLPVAEFGLAAAALTAHELTRMFVQNGLGTRIVTARPGDMEATATAVHRMNWALGLLLAFLQLAAAYSVGQYFGSPSLALAVAALAVVHLVYPAAMVRVYLAQRNGNWNTVAIAIAGTAVIDNLLTAVLAFAGFGLWSVVIPKLAGALAWIVWHRRRTPWSPGALPSREDYRSLAAFAAKVLGVEILASLRNHADKAFVGLMMGPATLGLYAFATNIGRGIALSISSSLASVLLPHIAKSREAGNVAAAYRQGLVMAALATAPFALLQAALAPWLVPLVFGAQWAPATGLVVALAIASIAHPVLLATSQLLRALERPTMDLAISAAATAASFAGLALGLPYGLMAAVCLSSAGLALVTVAAVLVGLALAEQEAPAAVAEVKLA